MPFLHLTCPYCQARFQAAEEQAGRRMLCPSCQRPVNVPAPLTADAASKVNRLVVAPTWKTALAAIVTLPLTVTTLELVPLKSRVPLLTLTGPALVKVLPKPEVLPAPVRFRKAPLWFVNGALKLAFA